VHPARRNQPRTRWSTALRHASGFATIVDEGHTYRVDQPEIIPMEAAAAHFSPKEQRNLRLFGVDQCLRVRRVETDNATEQLGDPQ
jgi:hypothetical protein